MLDRFIRECFDVGVAARFASRVGGGSFRGVQNALAVDGMGSRGVRRVGQGPRIVIVPVSWPRAWQPEDSSFGRGLIQC